MSLLFLISVGSAEPARRLRAEGGLGGIRFPIECLAQSLFGTVATTCSAFVRIVEVRVSICWHTILGTVLRLVTTVVGLSGPHRRHCLSDVTAIKPRVGCC